MQRWSQPCLACLSLALCVLAPGQAPGDPPEKETLEAIHHAWQQRQDRVRSARFEWMMDHTVTKGTTSYFRSQSGPRAKRKYENGPPIPPRDMTYSAPASLQFEGIKVRYEGDLGEWSEKAQALVADPVVSVYTGQLAKRYQPQAGIDKPWPQGSVAKGSRLADLRGPTLFPIMQTFRALTPETRVFTLAEVSVSNRQAVIERVKCIELSLRLPGSPVLHRYWLDPARDFVLVRSLTTQNGAPLEQVDIRYQPDPVAGWVPERWNLVTHYGKHNYLESYQGVVTSRRINPTLSADEFDLTFPPKTRVADRVTKTQYMVDATGGSRPIAPSEQAKPNEEIFQTGPPMSAKRRSLIGWGAALAGAGLALGLLLRWRRQRRDREAVIGG